MTEHPEKSNVQLPQPSGERPTGQSPRRVDPCEGVAAPSQPGDSRPPGQGQCQICFQLPADQLVAVRQPGEFPDRQLPVCQYCAGMLFAMEAGGR
jgi:hypothetical protein